MSSCGRCKGRSDQVKERVDRMEDRVEASQARRGPTDGDPRDATIEGLQSLVKQLQQTIEGLQRQLAGKRDVEYLPAQEYGRQHQQRQQQKAEQRQQQQQQQQHQQPVPWTTVVKKKKADAYNSKYGPKQCGIRAYGSGLDRFEMFEHAKPCTCVPGRAGDQKPQQRGTAAATAAATTGQRSFIQALVQSPSRMKSKVVAKPVPQQNGTPLQPCAKAVGQLSDVIGLTVMQGARAYTERQ